MRKVTLDRSMGAIAGAALSLLSTFPLGAAEIPHFLRGKSLSLSWSRSMTFRLLSGDHSGREFTRINSLGVTLYVSAKGRVFSSFRDADSSVSNDVQGVGENNLHWRYEVGVLVADHAFLKGDRRIVVSSSDGFKTCSMTIKFAKLRGTATLIVKGNAASDAPAEIIDVKFLSATCSVQEGNIFDTAK
jgi:hypothetical protein